MRFVKGRRVYSLFTCHHSGPGRFVEKCFTEKLFIIIIQINVNSHASWILKYRKHQSTKCTCWENYPFFWEMFMWGYYTFFFLHTDNACIPVAVCSSDGSRGLDSCTLSGWQTVSLKKNSLKSQCLKKNRVAYFTLCYTYAFLFSSPGLDCMCVCSVYPCHFHTLWTVLMFR